MKRIVPSLVGLCLLMVLFATPASAQEVPPFPHAFYGAVEINNSAAPIRTQVEARGAGVETSKDNPITVTEAGRYGGPGGLDPKLVVQGNIEEGTIITFYVDGESTGQTAEWHSDEVTELNLSVTIAAPSRPSRGGGEAATYIETDLFGTKKSVRIESDGEILTTIEATSEDGMLTITIPKGTIALDKDGDRLDSLEAAVDESPPDPPEDAHIIGLAYDFGPDGANFDPPITFTWSYGALPKGVDEEDLVIAYYDEAAGEWVEVDCVVDTGNDAITASVEHFTTFAVLAYARAAFYASDLSISPSVVGVGEEVTTSVLVTNSGGLSGTYELILRIDDVVATEDVTLDAGASQTVTFTISRDVAGTYAISVDGLSGTFDVKGPAAFATSDLTITPAEVEVGEEVTITVVVANTGLSGSYKVTLEVDGVAVDTRVITLDGGTSVIVPFTISRDVAGTYSVEVDDLSGTFEVKAPPEEKPAAFTVSQLSISPAEVDVGETVTISVLVANTGDLSGSYEAVLQIDGVTVDTKDVTLKGGASQKVTFTTSRDVAGTYAISVDGLQGTLVVRTPEAPNWPLIGGIIAGVLVIGLLVYFLWWRRRPA